MEMVKTRQDVASLKKNYVKPTVVIVRLRSEEAAFGTCWGSTETGPTPAGCGPAYACSTSDS